MAEMLALQAGPGGAPVSAMSAPPRLTRELRPLAACAGLREDWLDLARRAVTPNPFLDPDVLLPAAQHLIGFRDASLILIWQELRGGRRLAGLQPVAVRSTLFGRREVALPPDAHLGDDGPLIDRDLARPVADCILAEIGGWRAPLAWRGRSCGGAVGSALLDAAGREGWTARLAVGPAAAAPAAVAGAAARLPFFYVTARQAVRDAVELHLALDASGARASAGRALLQDTREAAFLRAMTRRLAARKLCRAAILSRHERPVAVAILIGPRSDQTLYRLAIDDAYADLQPEAALLGRLKIEAPPLRLTLAPPSPTSRRLASRAARAFRAAITLRRAAAA